MNETATFEVDRRTEGLFLFAAGDWSAQHVVSIDADLREATQSNEPVSKVVFDLTGLRRLDTSGAWLIYRTAESFVRAGTTPDFVGLTDEFDAMLHEVAAHDRAAAPPVQHVSAYTQVAGEIGDSLIMAGHEVQGLVGFFGESLVALGRGLINPKRIRLVPLMHHMEKAGFDALPIVSLLTFLVGAVLAQQGAVQLRRFGADVFTVNMVSISFLREIGILLVAIIVAGRSGSAFTAEIGSMKMREEIDAMRTLGLDPFEMLVLPRVLALIIVLPFLTFVGDIMGLFGGGVVAWTMLDMSPGVYIVRVREAVDFWTFGVGILKAPFMALVIALIGCYSGMKVTGSAESVGQQTTQSVVKSIFVVIVLNALFAIFFTAMGI